jgi:hypothetical protein
MAYTAAQSEVQSMSERLLQQLDSAVSAWEETLEEGWQETVRRLHDLESRMGAAVDVEALRMERDALAQRLAAVEAEGALAAGEVAALQAELAVMRKDAAYFEQLVAERDAALAAVRAELCALREAAERKAAEAAVVSPSLAALEAPTLYDAPVSRGEARAIAHFPQEEDAFDGAGHKRRMGEIMLRAGLISEGQLTEVLAAQGGGAQRRFGAIAVERGFTTEEAIARVLAAQLRLPYVDLAATPPSAEAMQCISPHVARMHHAVPFRLAEDALVVAMANPLDLIAIEDLEIASKRRVEPVVATGAAIAACLAQL